MVGGTTNASEFDPISLPGPLESGSCRLGLAGGPAHAADSRQGLDSLWIYRQGAVGKIHRKSLAPPIRRVKRARPGSPWDGDSHRIASETTRPL